jgi:ankyrin repeat protein
VTISSILKARRNVINLTDSFGRTPLILASALGHGELVTLLLDHGADIASVTPEGYNTFNIAKNSKIRDIPERRLLSWLNKRHHVADANNSGGSSGRGYSVEGGYSGVRGLKVSNDEGKDSSNETKGDLKGPNKRANDNDDDGKANDDDDDDDGKLLRSADQLRDETLRLSESLRNCSAAAGTTTGFMNGTARSDTRMLGNSLSMSTNERAIAVTSLSMELQRLQDKNWSYSRSPLTWAVHNGLLTTVQDLLQSGAKPDEHDTEGRQPLHECADLLKSAQLVHVEAAVGIAEALITTGASVNAQTISKRTPLHEVFCKGQDETVSYCRVTSGGQVAPLFNTTSTTHNSKLRASTTGTTTGDSILKHEQVVSKCRRVFVRTLLQLGANPFLLDRYGLAPIHYCARENFTSCMLEILRSTDARTQHAHHSTSSGTRGAGTGSTSIGATGAEAFLSEHLQTPMHIACKAGAAKVAHLLARWDADSPLGQGLLNRQDIYGKTPTQCLSVSMPASALDTLWAASRAGNVTRYRVAYYIQPGSHIVVILCNSFTPKLLP